MDYQFASTYSLVIIMFLLALFLFLRLEKDNRARLFLAIAFLLFGTSMLFQFICVYVLNKVEQVDFSMSFITTIICTTGLTYPLEVLYPKSVNQRKIFKLYSPLIILLGVYLVALLNGYQFQNYISIVHLFTSLPRLDAMVYLSLLTYIGAFIVYAVVLFSTHKNEQINPRWFTKYLITFIVMNLFYQVSIVSNAGLHMISKYIFILCCGYITYLELYERLCPDFVHAATSIDEQPPEKSEAREALSPRETMLRVVLIDYMEKEKAWRDPDITVKDVTTKLRTNRRVLNSVVQEMGYDNFPSYINYLRVKDFTEIIENSKDDSFQNIFFNVGFKSRATAHRNFKNIKGLSPSEYYDSIKVIEEE
ncbi:MAG: hypothetical protein ACRC13_10475 [Tannerellaceae bacterium]